MHNLVTRSPDFCTAINNCHRKIEDISSIHVDIHSLILYLSKEDFSIYYILAF